MVSHAQRFRARKVDLRRALPVYRASDLDDLEDDDNRQVDAIETGVEKDEEAEHHLQAAISATHAAHTGGAPTKQVYIPTPDASKRIPGYDKLYRKDFKCPTSLIRSSETVEECCAPMYCLDDEDDRWLATANKKRAKAGQQQLTADQFEVAMDQLEALTKDMIFTRVEDIPTIEYLATHAADRDRPFEVSTIEVVFEHWQQRRQTAEFKPIMPALQLEDVSKTEIDPYVCFRRREVRQGRKTRRADQRSLEQMRRMRSNLSSVAQLLDSCMAREQAKLEITTESVTIMQQRANVLRMRRKLNATAQEFDDLFVPPVQQRKRMGARDPAQRGARGNARKPRTASGLAASAAAASASANASPRVASALGDAVVPQPYVLPRTVPVHQYPVPKHIIEMQDRLRAQAAEHDQQLSSDWVDATFNGGLSLHTNPAITPAMASFWSPQMTPTRAYRVRRGRLGRMYLDRRAVRSHSVPYEKVQMYRLGLLKPDDFAKLRPSHPNKSVPAVSSVGLPEDLLRPFTFTASLVEAAAAQHNSARQPQSQPLTPPSANTPASSSASSSDGSSSVMKLSLSSVVSSASVSQPLTPPLSIIGAASLPELSITPTPTSLMDKGTSPQTPVVSSIGSVTATKLATSDDSALLTARQTMQSLPPNMSRTLASSSPAMNTVASTSRPQPDSSAVAAQAAAAAAIRSAATAAAGMTSWPQQHRPESSVHHGTASG